MLVLRLAHPPSLRVDLRDLDTGAMGSRAPSDVARLRVWHGNEAVELGALFRVSAVADDAEAPQLRFEGDCARFDYIGRSLAVGRIVVDGNAGHYVGASMAGGEIVVNGHAGMGAGCAMAGGRLAIGGDAGDFAAGAFPGDMEGMHGGTLVVSGSAGARLGDRMRRGTIVVGGSAGSFAASRMVAGTIAIGGSAGEHTGFGMRRGTVVLAGASLEIDATFVPVPTEIGVIWPLLARGLARFGAPFDGLLNRHPRRYLGDRAVDGTGEILVAG